MLLLALLAMAPSQAAAQLTTRASATIVNGERIAFADEAPSPDRLRREVAPALPDSPSMTLVEFQ